MNMFTLLRYKINYIYSLPLLGIFLYFYLTLFENAYIDDTYITLRYVKTLIESGTWGFYPNYIANSATSPLNVILLTIFSFFTETPIVAVKWFTLFNFLVLFVLLTKISNKIQHSYIFGILTFIAILFNPLLISTMGLESILFTTLFVSAVYFYLEKQWMLAALMLSLLTITRPEGGLFFIVFLLFVPTIKLKFRFILVFLMGIAPWYIFSWIHLGSFLPDTFFIKTSQKSWGPWDFYNGFIMYYKKYPAEMILSFAFLPLIVLLGNKKVWKLKNMIFLIGLGGLAHFIGYSLLKVPPYHWYYTPEIFTIIILGVLLLTESYIQAVRPLAKNIFGILIIIYLIVPVGSLFYLFKKDHYNLREMPIHTNWATKQQYKKIAFSLDNFCSNVPVSMGGEIGTLAYYSNCLLFDQFSDRRWTKKYVNKKIKKSRFSSLILRTNFLFFKIPKYPSMHYRLRGYHYKKGKPNNNPGLLKRWETSSKWAGRGFIDLSKK